MNSIPNDLVSLGEIITPHGIKGELKVFLYNNESQALVDGLTIWVNVNDRFSGYEVISIRGSLKNKLLKIKYVDTFDIALSFSKHKIYVSRDDFVEIKAESFYLNDLIGCNAIDENNKNCGKVIDVLTFPSNNVILINYDNREVMIPIVEDFIELFDLKNGLIKLKNIKFFFEL